jgi:hypothetical protein
LWNEFVRILRRRRARGFRRSRERMCCGRDATWVKCGCVVIVGGVTTRPATRVAVAGMVDPRRKQAGRSGRILRYRTLGGCSYVTIVVPRPGTGPAVGVAYSRRK